MKTYEYKFILFGEDRLEQSKSLEDLKDIGKEGWLLVSDIERTDDYPTRWLKGLFVREIKAR